MLPCFHINEVSTNLNKHVAAFLQSSVEEKDIIVAATNSSIPVLDGSWISEGAHVTSIVNSDHRFPRRELDNETFARSDLVVIGSVEQSRQDHAADIFETVQAGALTWERVCELGEVVTGMRGRRNDKEITLFKNNALAVEFTALAWKVFDIVQKGGLGEEIPSHYYAGAKAFLKE